MSSCGVAASADGVGHSGLVLYVNGEYRDDSDIGKLMHDFNCTSADDMNFEILAEKPRYLKKNPKGVSEMCKVMEDLRDESYAEVRAECHAEGWEEQAQMTAKNLYEQGLTIDASCHRLLHRISHHADLHGGLYRPALVVLHQSQKVGAVKVCKDAVCICSLFCTMVSANSIQSKRCASVSRQMRSVVITVDS